jgi:hypothetical protein
MAESRKLRIHCGACDELCRLKDLECPSCGSDNIRMTITLSTGGRASAPARSLSFSVNVPPGASIRSTVKYEYSEKYGVVIVERTFDKLERKYHEVYYDLDGNVVFEKHPDLDDQDAHGQRGKAPGAGQEHPFEAILRILPHLPPDHPAIAAVRRDLEG